MNESVYVCMCSCVYVCMSMYVYMYMCVYIHVDVKGRIAELFVLFLVCIPEVTLGVTLSGRCLYSLNRVIGPTNDTLKSLGKNLPALSCHPTPHHDHPWFCFCFNFPGFLFDFPWRDFLRSISKCIHSRPTSGPCQACLLGAAVCPHSLGGCDSGGEDHCPGKRDS